MKKIVYIDMDNVIVNFQSGIDKLDQPIKDAYEGIYDEVPHIFSIMEPIEGSIEAIRELNKKYHLYILSTSPWDNPTALQDKLNWIKSRFGGADKDNIFYKKVIFSHHKNLLNGDYLIDDRTENGASEFQGEHIHFGTEKFPNWKSVLVYLMNLNV